MTEFSRNKSKAFLYARVSSDRQEREGFSIPAQIKLLHDYSTKYGIKIAAEFVEAETAKKSGRKQFNEMIKFLKKNKSVRTILVEKTDRLYHFSSVKIGVFQVIIFMVLPCRFIKTKWR